MFFYGCSFQFLGRFVASRLSDTATETSDSVTALTPTILGIDLLYEGFLSGCLVVKQLPDVCGLPRFAVVCKAL